MRFPIGFGIITKLHFFPLLLSIVYCCKYLLENFLINDLLHKQLGTETKYPVFLSFISLLGNVCMGIPLGMALIYNKCFVKENTNGHKRLGSSQDINKTCLEENPIKQIQPNSFRQECLTYSLIAFVALLVSFILPSLSILTTEFIDVKIGFQMNICLISFEAGLSYVILRYSMFKHQIISILLTFLGIFLIVFGDTIFYEKLQIAVKFLAVNLIVALVDVCEKFLMEKRYFTQAQLIFLIGVFVMIYYAIAFGLMALQSLIQWIQGSIPIESMKDLRRLFQLVNDADGGVKMIIALILIADVLMNMMYMVCFYSTNYYFTPTHRGMSDIMSAFLIWIGTTISERFKGFQWYVLLGYLMICFGALTYNEMIIMNCCGLEENTKMRIRRRARDDFKVQFLTGRNTDYNEQSNDDDDDQEKSEDEDDRAENESHITDDHRNSNSNNKQIVEPIMNMQS